MIGTPPDDGSFTNDPKIHDAIGNRKTNPIDLADSSHSHGVGFLEASKHILRYMPEYSDVAGANLAFACELFIKSMLHFQGIKFKKEHNLKNLYLLLPKCSATRNQIKV